MQIVNTADFQESQQAQMDATLLVRFFVKPRQDPAKSREAGRPIFTDTEYIEIRTPGSRDAVCRPAKPRDIARFPKHYEMFKNRTEGDIDEGTPLSEWPQVSRSMAEELGFFNVRTVEQLVAMSDQNASQFMGINSLKQKAKAWLDLAKENEASAHLAQELQKRDDEIAELKAAIKAIEKSAPVKKKRARKKATAKKE